MCVSQINLRTGSRDPYAIEGDGTGFSFCWDGDTCVTIGHENNDREIFQVRSDKLLIVIPRSVAFLKRA